MKPPYAIGSVPSLSGHAIAYRWRSLPRVRRHRASKPQGSSERVLPWQITMDQLTFASLSHTHYWYEVGMLKVPAVPGVRIKHVHGIFKGRRERTRTGQKVPRFPAQLTLSPDKPIPGSAEGVNEKRQLSPGLSPTSPIALVSPLKYPRPGAGILTRFPFYSGGTEAASSERTSPIS